MARPTKHGIGCEHPAARLKDGHELALLCRKLQCFPNTLKCATLNNTAGVALVDGCAQRGKRRLNCSAARTTSLAF